MSTVDKEANDIVSVCANCGKEGDNLKSCAACKLVKYCSRDCQQAHRPQHKKECRKRAAELHDEELFKQPPPEYGDCPICFIQVPALDLGRRYMSCCGKIICSGCRYAPLYDDQGNEVGNEKCPFCRVVAPDGMGEAIERMNKRVDAGDAQAMYNVGAYYQDGIHGLPQDVTKALELWHQAAELGCAYAYGKIGYSYRIGRGVEVDKKKATHYCELGAMGGSESARHNLGCIEAEEGNFDRALKHFMIAIRGGHSKSLKLIQRMYLEGHATKEDYTEALQSYQVYLSEIKSKQRDEAAAAYDHYRYC